MMAPNVWDSKSKSLTRPLTLSNSYSVSVTISHPRTLSFLVIQVHGINNVSRVDEELILQQVGRMLRISAQDDRDVTEFQQLHEDAKKNGFGRIFRSLLLFEDMVKFILLCNNTWISASSSTLHAASLVSGSHFLHIPPSPEPIDKTSFYASGLTPSETDLIQASTGMALGSLPFRYLGVPLNSRKLSLTNCEPLIHQIKTRILTRLAWQATLYWLWTERNTRLHTQMFRSVDQIFKLLDRQLKNKLQSFRDTNPTRSSIMMQSWFRFVYKKKKKKKKKKKNNTWERTLGMASSLCILQSKLADGTVSSQTNKKSKRVVKAMKETKEESSKKETRGNFPSAKEKASLDKELINKHCKLGYRANLILKLAKMVESGKLNLEEMERRDIKAEEMSEKLKKLKGFGAFVTTTVLMCIGYYHLDPKTLPRVYLYI
ncbi:hypothetical protein HID58_070952 [Brassica napus]|uniref:Uncharacterized protein n=1 Tax=Brassica napus TaxID=3708 RepID=A0ABQ7Z074_BRANA|nr:hypothetical protein HID58_070952 [Brassica napus]